MKLIYKKGSTDVTVQVFVQDSSQTDGRGLSTLTYDSVGLACYYSRPGSVPAVQALATQTVIGAHSDGGFVAVDTTNMPGVYRLDLKDAIFATGVNHAIVMLRGATNMAPVLLEIQLVDYDSTDGVRLGLTALPNTACTSNASLVTSGTGTDQISVSGGRAKADVSYWATAAVATPDTSGYPKVTIKDGTGQGEINLDTGRVDANVTYWKGAVAGDLASKADFWGHTTRTLTAPTNITDTDGEIHLGSDGHVLLSADVHSSGATVAAVTGNIGGNVNGDVGGNVSGSIGSIASNGINATSIQSGAITNAHFSNNAISSGAISSDAVTKIAGGVLSNSSNRLTTDASGRVTPRLERITKGAALNNFEFLMVLTSDHATPATGKTITATRSIDGGTFGACTNTATEVPSTGVYHINLSADDLNGDVITLSFAAALCDTRFITIITQEQS